MTPRAVIAAVVAAAVALVVALGALVAGCGPPPPPDPRIDPTRCGAAARDCLGGECQNGVCQPVVLARLRSKGDRAGLITVDGTHVYFANQSTSSPAVLKVEKAKVGSAAMTLAPLGQTPLGLLLDDSAGGGLYVAVFGNNATGSLIRVSPVDGGVTTLAGNLNLADDRPTSLALSGTTLFWSTRDGIGRVSVADGAPAAVTRLFVPVQSLAILGGDVYFTDGQPAPQGTISRFPVAADTPAPARVVELLDAPGALAVDSDGLYWIGNGGRLQRAGHSSDAPTLLAVNPDLAAGALAVAGDSVYYGVRAMPATILRAPKKTGNNAAKIATSDAASNFALDASALYWSTGDTVMKVAR